MDLTIRAPGALDVVWPRSWRSFASVVDSRLQFGPGPSHWDAYSRRCSGRRGLGTATWGRAQIDGTTARLGARLGARKYRCHWFHHLFSKTLYRLQDSCRWSHQVKQHVQLTSIISPATPGLGTQHGCHAAMASSTASFLLNVQFRISLALISSQGSSHVDDAGCSARRSS